MRKGKGMGRRRRRKEVRIEKPRLPKFFTCPHCGSESVVVKIDKRERKALVSCGACNISWETRDIKEYEEPIDIYNRFVDAYLEGRVSPPEGSKEGAEIVE